MRCPRCREKDTRVTDSRTAVEGESVRRRRECVACGHRFTTYERIEATLPMVVKKDGRREPFRREKVRAGLLKAIEKRDVSTDEIDGIIDRLERAMEDRGGNEVPSSTVGEFLMDELREIDDVAYVRFASVYREFKDIGEFMEALTSIRRSRRGDGT